MNFGSNKKERVQTLRSRLKEVAADAILEAAEEIFMEAGLEARMETIAARAGVSVGTLYNHFADRDALVSALMQSRRRKIFEVMQEVVAKPSESLRDHLIEIVVMIADVKGSTARMRRLLIDAAGHSALERQRQGREMFRSLLDPLFAKARKSGLLQPDPHKLQASMFMGLIHTVLVLTLDESSKTPTKQVAETIVDTFLKGAGKP